VVPPDGVILEQLSEALELKLRDDFDRALDAVDPGELLEHATLTQTAVDRGVFGLDALFVVGDELFDYEFRPEQGLGNALAGRLGTEAGPRHAPNLRRVHGGELGGPDSHNCSTCHSKGGLDGAGHNTQNAFLRGDGDSTRSADIRNPPHVLGLGPVEALAREMTLELQSIRDRALKTAAESGKPVEAVLAAKGVSFGSITALPGGALDTKKVEGVDPDLVVKPFGWKGHQATIRGMVEESFRIHLGIVSTADQSRLRDGKLDAKDLGDGPWYDPDRDGVALEVDEGMLTTLTAYLAQLEAPIVKPPQTPDLADAFARGRALFDRAGCASCHRPFLGLENVVLELRPTDPEYADRPPIRVNVAEDGEQPKIEPQNGRRTAYNVHLLSDLKRHDMGPGLATPKPQRGIPPAVFLTRPLWGLAFAAPYLHDGRAPTVDDAIRLHGGEAAQARDAYTALATEDRAALQVFLLSQTRQPKVQIP